MRSNTKAEWIPKTGLGRKVMDGEITSLAEVFEKGYIIREPEIVDVLIPNLETHLIRTGGMPGKGGGKMRTSIRITTRMHKSGRRRTLHALVVAGNKNGFLGVGYATGEDAQRSIQKAERYAKLNMIPIIRGCGSWECGCGGAHSLPFKVHGRAGSVNVELLPAPRGLGLCVPHETKRIFQLAGVTDVWMRSYGNTSSRLNFTFAIFEALKKINKMRLPKKAEDAIEAAGIAAQEAAAPKAASEASEVRKRESVSETPAEATPQSAEAAAVSEVKEEKKAEEAEEEKEKEKGEEKEKKHEHKEHKAEEKTEKKHEGHKEKEKKEETSNALEVRKRESVSEKPKKSAEKKTPKKEKEHKK